ncbi:MAG: PIN domain-containing protein [Spirochaetota bacterium]
MTLVDTSSWIEQLRSDGDTTVRARVEALLQAGEAAWCSIVRLELWNGARGERERSAVRTMEMAVASLEIGPAVWDEAATLARAARQSGIIVPATDLLVAACSRCHGVPLEHSDRHFELIAGLERT